MAVHKAIHKAGLKLASPTRKYSVFPFEDTLLLGHPAIRNLLNYILPSRIHLNKKIPSGSQKSYGLFFREGKYLI